MKREKKDPAITDTNAQIFFFLPYGFFFWEKGVSEGAVLTLSFFPPFFLRFKGGGGGGCVANWK